MKRLTKIMLLAACLLPACILFPVWAQTIVEGTFSHSDPVTDLSSNAEATQNINVDLYRGIPKISIPLYTVHNKRASASVSLNYSPPSKDIRIIYHPGWTGMDWTLSVGGAITRTVRGTRDESVTKNGVAVWPLCINPSECDPMEDEFVFNFCGYSGKFFWHNHRWIIHDTSMPQVEISMDYTGGNNVNNPRAIRGFELIMPNGFRYTFGAYGRPQDSDYWLFVEGSSTWYLSQIKSPEGDCLYFTYERPSEGSARPVFNYTRYDTRIKDLKNHLSSSSYLKEFPATPGVTPDPLRMSSEEPSSSAPIADVFLKSITGGLVDVFFHRSPAVEKRYYYYSSPIYSYKLDAIELREANKNHPFKIYRLSYSNDTTQVLRLLSVREEGIHADNSVVDKPAHTFNYYDAWPSSINTKRMSPLQKISYPTGGFATFEYEIADEDTALFRAVDLVNNYWRYNKHHALRIKKMTASGSPGDTPTETHYMYGQVKRSRSKILTSTLSVPKDNNNVLDARIYTNYDQYVPTSYKRVCPFSPVSIIKPDDYHEVINEPDIVGHEQVTVSKGKQGAIGQGSTVVYHFSNYSYEEKTYGLENLKRRASFYKAGTLIRTEDWSKSRNVTTDYDYIDREWKTDTVQHKWVRGFPYTEYGAEKTYVDNHQWRFHYNFHSPKPTKITESFSERGGDSMRVTEIKYDQATGRIRHRETRDRAGNVYRTEYRYYNKDRTFGGYDYGIRDLDTPVETVTKKNGRVIAATVTQDTILYLSGNNIHIMRPVRVFALAVAAPVTDYVPATLIVGGTGGTTTVDPRCKLMTSYRYDHFGLPVRVQHTGELPSLFVWHPQYSKPLIVIEGAEEADYINACNTAPKPDLNVNASIANQIDTVQKLRKRLPNARITSYTYNLHGVTSVTDPTGYTRYTEYDVFGRPLLERDDEGNIIRSTRYNYGIN